MTIPRTESTYFNIENIPCVQRLWELYEEDFVIEHKPSIMTITHDCGKTHRLVHESEKTYFFCGGKEQIYQYPTRRIVSITPPSTPEMSPASTPERPTVVYVIPQRRFIPVKLFNEGK